MVHEVKYSKYHQPHHVYPDLLRDGNVAYLYSILAVHCESFQGLSSTYSRVASCLECLGVHKRDQFPCCYWISRPKSPRKQPNCKQLHKDSENAGGRGVN